MPFPEVQSSRYMPARQTTELRFADGAIGEYYFRGGIAWPVVVESGAGKRIIGAACMVGVNVETDRACVFQYAEWNVVDPQPVGPFASIPLSPFLLKCWATYHAAHYYWHDRGETNRQYRGEIHRSENIQPKPILQPVPWEDDAVAGQILFEATAAGRVKMEQGTYEAIREEGPGRHALVCALVGLTRWPWEVIPRHQEREW